MTTRGIPTFRNEPRDESRKRNSSREDAGGGRTQYLRPSFHVSSVARHVSRGLEGNWRHVESENSSVAVDVGEVLPRPQMDGGRRRVGNQPTNDFPATRRRQHRRPSRCRVQPFLNATPLRRPRYLITRFTHSSSISASRGTFPPGRYTRARRANAQNAFSSRAAELASVFFAAVCTRATTLACSSSQLHARGETRAARPFFSFSRVSHTARRRHDVANGAAASFGRTRRLASKPPISPSVATTRAIPRCRGSGARLTGRIPAVSRPSRRMPS